MTQSDPFSTPKKPSASADPKGGRAYCGRNVKSRPGGKCLNGPVGGVPGKPCVMHGGKAPQVMAAAAREKAEEGVRKTAAMIMREATPVGDPLAALQQLAGEMTAWKDALGGQVDILKLGYSSEMGTEQIRAAVQLYEKALDRLGTTLANIGRLNIDARLIAIEEGKKEMILRAIQAALTAAGVTGEAQTAAIGVAGRELRVINGGLSKKKAAGY